MLLDILIKFKNKYESSGANFVVLEAEASKLKLMAESVAEQAVKYYANLPTTQFALRNGTIREVDESLLGLFDRLSIGKNWTSTIRAEKRKDLERAVCDEVETSLSSLHRLQELCAKYDLPVGKSLTQCRKSLKTKYVNIWDILDENPTTFPNYKSLRRDIKHRSFSKTLAKDAQLNVFLITT
jgi:hypothetical protein